MPGASAITVTLSLLPGPCGAATVTGTSAVRSAPGGSSPTPAGRGVVTPGPSTRTRTGPGAPAPGGPPATVTRTTWHGPCSVLTNNGVDCACTIRMTSWSHVTGRAPPPAGPGPRA